MLSTKLKMGSLSFIGLNNQPCGYNGYLSFANLVFAADTLQIHFLVARMRVTVSVECFLICRIKRIEMIKNYDLETDALLDVLGKKSALRSYYHVLKLYQTHAET